MVNISTINGKTLAEIEKMDSAGFAAFTANINKEDGKSPVPMSREEFKRYTDSISAGLFSFSSAAYHSVREYDSLRAAGVAKEGWLMRLLIYKNLELNEKYHSNPRDLTRAFKSKLVHSIPQMLFISLPLLALLLKLLYIRRKQFYYISHAIFSIYLYIFVFASLLVLFGLNGLNSRLHWSFFDWVGAVLYISLFIYEYIALRNFYKQGWFKTFLKFLLLNILFFIMIGILFLVFIFFSFFKI